MTGNRSYTGYRVVLDRVHVSGTLHIFYIKAANTNLLSNYSLGIFPQRTFRNLYHMIYD